MKQTEDTTEMNQTTSSFSSTFLISALLAHSFMVVAIIVF